MFKLRRYLALVVPLILLAFIAGCGDDDEEDSNGGEPTVATVTITPEPTLSAACAAIPTATPPQATPPEVQVKSYPAKPEMAIDPAKTYIAHVYLEEGRHIIINLLPDLAPEHVNSFVFLANDDYFDGQVFHRVVKSPEPFVAQTGDPTGTGTGGPGYSLPLEASRTPFDRGAVGAARTNDPNSAGSQWFITLGPATHLNGQYTVFGQVVSGMDAADCINQGDRIVEITIEEL
jgi:peptidylprolyl isomerase